MDLKRFLHIGLRDEHRFGVGVHFLLRNGAGGDERFVAVVVGLGFFERRSFRLERSHAELERGDLVVDVLDCVLKTKAKASRLAFVAADSGLGRY